VAAASYDLVLNIFSDIHEHAAEKPPTRTVALCELDNKKQVLS